MPKNGAKLGARLSIWPDMLRVCVSRLRRGDEGRCARRVLGRRCWMDGEVWTTLLHARHGWPCAAPGALRAKNQRVTTCTAAERLDQTVHAANRTPARIASSSRLSLPALARTHALLPHSRRPSSSCGPLAGETARILPRPHLPNHSHLPGAASPRPVLVRTACLRLLPSTLR